ncbi:MAG TPA: tyrosine--tRNA ligase [Solirubrobacterales bacterium]|nr:tyrosine--tRNA ligase [Solirubrobacterales bacterium]
MAKSQGEPSREARDQAARLARRAVDVLPAGRLAEQLSEGRPLRVKFGIDPTAPDIHLGHTVALGKLREFQDEGHTVVLIIGDFTARVGDPSGRSAQRPVLGAEEIDANARTFQEQAFKVLDPERTEVRFNSEWLRMEAGELFGLMARATVARLLERDDFQKRLRDQAPIALLELLYPLLQGYDSAAIDADVEVGGTEQKFNLLVGRDIQSALGKEPQSILTMPILTGIDGSRRMSKSLDNYIGVTDPPQEMFGKVMRIPDELMPAYFDLVLRRTVPDGVPPNEAKRALARDIVGRFHGNEAAVGAEEHFDRLFVRHEAPEKLEELTVAPNGDVHLPAVLAEGFGLSRSEARRLLDQGGVRLDGEVVPGEPLDVDPATLDGRVLQVGRRRHRRVRVAG